jgi:chemotaxis protein histidine kinase CheA
MSDNNSEVNETVVDVDVSTTDDLDAFEAEFFGTAKPEEEAEEQKDVTDVAADTDAEVEEGSETETEEVEEEEEEEQEEPEPHKKNRKTAKERISELTAKVRETEAAAAARVAELEARLAKLEKTEEPNKETVSETVTEGPKLELPDPDERDDKGELVYPLGTFDPKYNAEVVRRTLKYEREVAAIEAEEKAAEEAEAARVKEAQKAQEELLTSWSVKLAETEKTVPDLRQKIAVLEDNFSNLEPTHGIFLSEAIMNLPRGPEVLCYLADNIGEAEAIVAMGPLAAAIALGEIHGRLPSKAKSEDSNKKKVSTAPTPPVTTRGNGAAVARVAPDTDNLDDFEREFFAPRKV